MIKKRKRNPITEERQETKEREIIREYDNERENGKRGK